METTTENEIENDVDENDQMLLENRQADYEKDYEIIEAKYDETENINKFDIKAKIEFNVVSNSELDKESVAAIVRNRLAGIHNLSEHENSEKFFVSFSKQEYKYLKRS